MSKVTQDQAWYWLTNQERTVLQDFNPDAEKIINAALQPDQLLTTTTQPLNDYSKPRLPEKHILISERSRRMVEVHHPLAPDYTKMDYRDCVVFKERSQYGLGDTWTAMVRMCMTPALLKALSWRIYGNESGCSTREIYLTCDIPGPANAKTVSLYVPTSYFRTKDWNEVVKRHMEGAVNYYRNGNFGDSQQEVKLIWAEKTEAALTCLEARVLRAIVENKL